MVSHGAATEVSEIETLRAMHSSLREQLEKVEIDTTIELSIKVEEIARLEKIVKEERAVRAQEQMETNRLLNNLLHQTEQGIPQQAYSSLLENGMVTVTTQLSDYQQQLLSRWEQGEIGNTAWAALDGSNPCLAVVLWNRIQAYPGKTLEIIYIDTNNFKLRINGRTLSKLYKY
eukprot:TRINITY_DN2002_c0_g1_i2.p1 TRINITY_DN2002_c0_g1~~TRINITY_DN2002_c0_g1_i2.p1  ORF type:complete len:174 (-),score=20.07 TRINITY_DN2002_c0_g1_i2:95-616(-)